MMLESDWLARLIGLVVMLGMNAALGLHLAEPSRQSQHTTTAGWLLFAVGSSAWVSIACWLAWPFSRD